MQGKRAADSGARVRRRGGVDRLRREELQARPEGDGRPEQRLRPVQRLSQRLLPPLPNRGHQQHRRNFSRRRVVNTLRGPRISSELPYC